jgi:hypothetical protein
MKLLALIDVADAAALPTIRAELADEIKASWTLFAEDVLREVYATELPTQMVFVLEAGGRARAEAQLRQLPLIASGNFSCELIELHPFVNWSLLFAR